MHEHHDHDRGEPAVNRRNVLCGGGAAVFGAMISSLLGGAKPARAEPLSGTAPEVDGLAVRVVTDSYQFAVAPSRKVDGVDIQHFGWGIGGDKPPGPTLASEFGLSMRAMRITGRGVRVICRPRDDRLPAFERSRISDAGVAVCAGCAILE